MNDVERLQARLRKRETIKTRKYDRIFRDPGKLALLEKYLKEGYTQSSLARYFTCDRSTVIHHARRIGIPPGGSGEKRMENEMPPDMFPVQRLPRLTKQVEIPEEKGEKINKGLPTYQDYLKAEQERKIKELLRNKL